MWSEVIEGFCGPKAQNLDNLATKAFFVMQQTTEIKCTNICWIHTSSWLDRYTILRWYDEYVHQVWSGLPSLDVPCPE